MNIDEATGLPELPEGYFWRVRADHVQIRLSLPDSEWRPRDEYGFFMSWIGPDEGKRETREVEVQVTRSRKGRWGATVSEEVTEVRYEQRYVNQSEEVVRAQTEKNGETTRKPGQYRAAEYRSRYGGYYGYYQGRELVSPGYTEPDTIIEHRHPVTRENILSVCERALVKFEAMNLRGDYPPKSLPRADQ